MGCACSTFHKYNRPSVVHVPVREPSSAVANSLDGPHDGAQTPDSQVTNGVSVYNRSRTKPEDLEFIEQKIDLIDLEHNTVCPKPFQPVVNGVRHRRLLNGVSSCDTESTYLPNHPNMVDHSRPLSAASHGTVIMHAGQGSTTTSQTLSSSTTIREQSITEQIQGLKNYDALSDVYSDTSAIHMVQRQIKIAWEGAAQDSTTSKNSSSDYSSSSRSSTPAQ